MLSFEGIDMETMLYGTLSVLDNRMQACQNDAYPDITMKQHFLMVCVNLYSEDYPTLKQASDLLGCSYQNVKRLATSLQTQGYLCITPDENDKRKLLLVPTGKFEECHAEKNHVAEQFMKRLYKGISKEELEITLNVIRKMTQNLAEE